MSTMQLDRISIVDFKWLQTWLKSKTSIVLDDSRRFLAEKRLGPILWRHRVSVFAELFSRLTTEPEGPLAAEVLDLLSNTETWFFRDAHPFDVLKNSLLPTLIEDRAQVKKLKIWSAGCSSGQEIYSISMLVRSQISALLDWELELVATDSSAVAITKAQSGLYSTEDVNRGLPVAMLVKYFKQEGTGWVLDPELCASISFVHGRVDEGADRPNNCDIIFFRNVLFHFDQALRKKMVSALHAQMSPGGCLFLGSGEHLEDTTGWEQVEGGRGFYYRRIA